MATERQIAANRANAKKSTGPKTAAGRSNSSRNSFRYGLSLPLTLDPATSAKADAIARALAGHEEEQLAPATELAQAQLELLRIRKVRAQLMADLDPASTDLDQLRRLAALDRYERSAATKWRLASRKIATTGTAAMKRHD